MFKMFTVPLLSLLRTELLLLCFKETDLRCDAKKASRIAYVVDLVISVHTNDTMLAKVIFGKCSENKILRT